MFRYCDSLISLDLSDFNISQVIIMGRMFYCCFKLNSLDLTNFNTSLVIYMTSMFKD